MSTANSFTWHLTGRNYWKKTFVGILSLVLINTLSASAAYSDGPNNAAGEKSANTIGTSIRHSSDQNEDFAIDLTELLRVIQFFNSNGFHCATGTEDGFAPGSGDSSCAAHNSDYNPQDWRIDLSELLRLIQFFNSNGYHSQCSSEDFFSPGPGAHYVCEGDGDVEAAFEVSTNHGSAPCKIRFQDTTQYESKDGGLSWRWNFGDGGTSNESNPAHSYLTPGVYTPELIITTVTGKEALFIYPGCIEIDPGTDSDRDGISDVDELVFGTNPSLWDTDRDTFGDGDEISAGTDPLVSNATPADNFLTLDGVDNLDILGMDNDRLILFQRGGSLDKALIISEGMTLYSTASIPRATLSKNGNKGLLDMAWGFIGEVAGVVTNTIQAGETIVYNGVTYLAAATEDGVVYVIQFVTKPLVEAFPNLDQSIQTSFNFSTDDPRLFPGGSPLNDYVVYDQNGLSLTIAEGHMSFSPSLFIRLFIEKGELKTATF